MISKIDFEMIFSHFWINFSVSFTEISEVELSLCLLPLIWFDFDLIMKWFSVIFSVSLAGISEEELPLCLLPLAVNRQYLVWYFLFTATVTTMVCTEYFRLIFFVFYGKTPLFQNETSQNWSKFVNFDPRITRIVIVMAGVFMTCWIPVEVAVFYYLHPTDPPSSEKSHKYCKTRI